MSFGQWQLPLLRWVAQSLGVRRDTPVPSPILRPSAGPCTAETGFTGLDSAVRVGTLEAEASLGSWTENPALTGPEQRPWSVIQQGRRVTPQRPDYLCESIGSFQEKDI